MKQIPEHEVETSHTVCQQEVQNSTTRGKIEADNFFFLVTHMDQCWNTTKKGAQE
jgi:hypothetical protein